MHRELAAPYIVEAIKRNPGLILQLGNETTKTLSDKFHSMTDEEKRRLQEIGIWIAEDLTGDLVAAATGLPIGLPVDIVVKKITENLKQDETPLQQIGPLHMNYFGK